MFHGAQLFRQCQSSYERGCVSALPPPQNSTASLLFHDAKTTSGFQSTKLCAQNVFAPFLAPPSRGNGCSGTREQCDHISAQHTQPASTAPSHRLARLSFVQAGPSIPFSYEFVILNTPNMQFTTSSLIVVVLATAASAVPQTTCRWYHTMNHDPEG